MNLEERLRQKIREHINFALNEISTTGNVAGYLTPYAFAGDGGSNAKRAKKMAKMIGYTLTKQGKRDIGIVDKLTESATNEVAPQVYINAFRYEGEISDPVNPMTEKDFASYMAKLVGYELLFKKLNENYHEFKKDDESSPQKKIAKSIIAAREQIEMAEKQISMCSKYQKETKMSGEDFWKMTQKQITKLETRLQKLIEKLREMRG